MLIVKKKNKILFIKVLSIFKIRNKKGFYTNCKVLQKKMKGDILILP